MTHEELESLTDIFDFTALFDVILRSEFSRRFIEITIDLQGCLPENAVFTRCFKENHGKLYIIVKLINCRIRK